MAKVSPKKKSNTGFLAVIGIILIAGGAGIWTSMTKKPVSIEAAPGAALPEAEGYLRGNPDAPITIIEFADFECPGCGQFATLQGPDIKARIIDAGLANFRFYDFPLTSIHPNTISAHMAAACANDQGKFWEMHDLIFAGQYDWNGQATSNPRKFMDSYAQQLGLDMKAFGECFDTQKHLARIQANAKMGTERGVQGTPTVMIGSRIYYPAPNFDQLKKIIDSITVSNAAAAPAGGN